MTITDTREKIMAAARRMVQARGYNALSFRELAAEIGIKSASVHYHFPTKGDLGAALAHRYTEDADDIFEGFLADAPAREACFRNYTKVFRAALVDDNRMCLCGIMAAEHQDLPAQVSAEVDRFTDLNVRWLMKALSSRRPDASDDELRQQALAIFAAIEGAQLLARGQGDIGLYDRAVEMYHKCGLIP